MTHSATCSWEAPEENRIPVCQFPVPAMSASSSPLCPRPELEEVQLCGSIGMGRQALAERKKDFMEHPSESSLLRYLAMLCDRQDYETILSIGTADGPVREIVSPPSGKNLSIWYQLIHAAAETGETGFIEQHLPTVLEACGKEDELDLLMCLLNVYEGEKLAAFKKQRGHSLKLTTPLLFVS